MVKDIAENPSLLNMDSAIYKMKLSTLESNLKKLRKKYEQFIPLDKLEWYLGGMQRLSYALNVIKKLSSTETLTVEINIPSETTKYSVALQNIQDYEFALGWYNVAKDFYEIFSEAKNKVDYNYILEKKPLLNEIEKLIVDAEDNLTIIPKDEYDDILRRINAAKLEKQNGWYFASLVDIYSAMGLINALIASKELTEKSVEEYLQEVKNKINALDENLKGGNYIWARIYLDHAIYFLKSAEHFYKEDSILTAKSKLNNALSLAYMAENVYNAMKEIVSFTSSEEIPAVGETEVVSEEQDEEDATTQKTPYIVMLLFGAIIGIVFASGVLIIAIYYLKKTHFVKIYKPKDLEKQLELAYATNRISPSEYATLKKKLQKEKKAAEKQQKERASIILEIDRINAELHAQTHLLRDLKHRFGQHLITDADYHIQLKKINDRIAKLQRDLKNARERLKKFSKKKTKFDLL